MIRAAIVGLGWWARTLCTAFEAAVASAAMGEPVAVG
jgi:hypothetical protein